MAPKAKSINKAKSRAVNRKATTTRQPKAQPVDDKAMKSFKSTSNYVYYMALGSIVGIVFNLWHFFSKGAGYQSTALSNLVGFLVPGALFGWCAWLLRQKRASAFGAFLAASLALVVWWITNRTLSGTFRLFPDILLPAWLAYLAYELYRAKSLGVLK